MRKPVLAISLTLAFGGAAYALNDAYDPIGSYRYPVRDGERYLKERGYKVLGGGARDYSSGVCSRGATRRYVVEKDNQVIRDFPVCYSPILWTHLPRGYS